MALGLCVKSHQFCSIAAPNDQQIQVLNDRAINMGIGPNDQAEVTDDLPIGQAKHSESEQQGPSILQSELGKV